MLAGFHCEKSDVICYRLFHGARRSVFECANIIAILNKLGIVESKQKTELFNKLDHLSSMITNFRKTLIK
jgi:four helix bundle protein